MKQTSKLFLSIVFGLFISNHATWGQRLYLWGGIPESDTILLEQLISTIQQNKLFNPKIYLYKNKAKYIRYRAPFIWKNHKWLFTSPTKFYPEKKLDISKLITNGKNSFPKKVNFKYVFDKSKILQNSESIIVFSDLDSLSCDDRIKNKKNDGYILNFRPQLVKFELNNAPQEISSEEFFNKPTYLIDQGTYPSYHFSILTNFGEIDSIRFRKNGGNWRQSFNGEINFTPDDGINEIDVHYKSPQKGWIHLQSLNFLTSWLNLERKVPHNSYLAWCSIENDIQVEFSWLINGNFLPDDLELEIYNFDRSKSISIPFHHNPNKKERNNSDLGNNRFLVNFLCSELAEKILDDCECGNIDGDSNYFFVRIRIKGTSVYSEFEKIKFKVRENLLEPCEKY